MTDKKRKNILVDRLDLIERRESCSYWTGRRGVYVFDKVKNRKGGRAPVAKIYLNRRYYSGMFETKKRKVYSGDTIENDSRKWLEIRQNNRGQIEIYKKM